MERVELTEDGIRCVESGMGFGGLAYDERIALLALYVLTKGKAGATDEQALFELTDRLMSYNLPSSMVEDLRAEFVASVNRRVLLN